jgi:cell division protein FtsB
MYVDGAPLTVNFNWLPYGRWFHLHLVRPLRPRRLHLLPWLMLATFSHNSGRGGDTMQVGVSLLKLHLATHTGEKDSLVLSLSRQNQLLSVPVRLAQQPPQPDSLR